MTSDPHSVPLLVGLGVDSLSVSARMFLRIKQTVRHLRHAAMAKLVAKAVTCSDSDEIRRLMRKDLVFGTNGGDFHSVRHRVPLETLLAALRGDVQRDRLPRALDNSTTRQTPGGQHSHRWGAGEAHPFSQQSGYGTGWDEPPEA